MFYFLQTKWKTSSSSGSMYAYAIVLAIFRPRMEYIHTENKRHGECKKTGETLKKYGVAGSSPRCYCCCCWFFFGTMTSSQTSRCCTTQRSVSKLHLWSCVCFRSLAVNLRQNTLATIDMHRIYVHETDRKYMYFDFWKNFTFANHNHAIATIPYMLGTLRIDDYHRILQQQRLNGAKKRKTEEPSTKKK